MIAVMMPATGGKPLARAMPRHRGSAMRKTRKPDRASPHTPAHRAARDGRRAGEPVESPTGRPVGDSVEDSVEDSVGGEESGAGGGGEDGEEGGELWGRRGWFRSDIAGVLTGSRDGPPGRGPAGGASARA
ncbi:hypothetical protein GCM10017673_28670 [Streptosporangium violaceochromogenes]|nr:hypothetical protein GCM10017673_28670 [Streptosporangium violaceochromogenes]